MPSMEADGRFSLLQPLADAEHGVQVQMTWDLLLSGLDPSGSLVLNIERGNLGETTVKVFNYLGDIPVDIKTFHWAGITSGRNSFQRLDTGLQPDRTGTLSRCDTRRRVQLFPAGRTANGATNARISGRTFVYLWKIRGWSL